MFIRNMIKRETGLAGALNRLNFSKGRSFAYLPVGFDPELTVQFDRDFFLNTPDGKNHLTARYVKLAGQFPSSALFFHDQWMTPDDFKSQALKRFEVRTESEVYCCLPHPDFTADNIAMCLSMMVTTNPACVFAIVTEDDTKRFFQAPFDESLVETIVDQTLEVFMPAYDRESFVVWSN